ncbi:hypothetical protein L9W77_12910 [Vibrio aestuarianus]|uniref:hypothetical protein n=1 Tax=Vibrio aestuarianus TaxID=28171 RepID=UPI00239E0C9B|nr:hypothetical protein [Vibrio aestuarianus]MDE1307853.1 hypothetical protein [Vibrio aestuarianus]WDS55462.1 hypothetical protein MCL29_06895 [Vibrio aestuarianus]
MTEISCKENIDKKFLTGMLITFFEEGVKLSKTDLKVYFNMYIYSDKYDYFKFDKYSDIECYVGVDKHQFSKSIKKLVAAECVVKNDNSFYLISTIPF